jgi:hypothetical protein
MCQVVNQSDNALVILCTGSDQNSIIATNWTTNDLHFQQNTNNNNNFINAPNSQTVFVYPPTFYVCEVYHNNGQYLVTNVSLPATLPLSQLSTNSILAGI